MQHIYVSYPQEDHVFAHRLVDDLQAAGYAVFVDAVSQKGTVAWAAETRQAIRSCGAVVMVLSPEDGRRVGIRHEGVLAKRRQKPVVVVRRTPGDVPRYLAQATSVDCLNDVDYGGALASLIAVLPPAGVLLAARSPVPARVRRPPRQPEQARQRRRVVIAVSLLIVLAVLMLAGIAFGVIPG